MFLFALGTGLIKKKKTTKKTTFISVHKDEEPLPRRSRSSGGRWRFNLAPDEWPIAALSEAAEAPAKCGGGIKTMHKNPEGQKTGATQQSALFQTDCWIGQSDTQHTRVFIL